MGRILHPLFALLASVSRKDLARQVAYLKEENRILRARLPERLVATDQEKRRVLRFGKKLGQQLKEDRPGESGPGTGLRKWGVVGNGRGVFDCPSATVASSFLGAPFRPGAIASGPEMSYK